MTQMILLKQLLKKQLFVEGHFNNPSKDRDDGYITTIKYY